MWMAKALVDKLTPTKPPKTTPSREHDTVRSPDRKLLPRRLKLQDECTQELGSIPSGGDETVVQSSQETRGLPNINVVSNKSESRSLLPAKRTRRSCWPSSDEVLTREAAKRMMKTTEEKVTRQKTNEVVTSLHLGLQSATLRSDKTSSQTLSESESRIPSRNGTDSAKQLVLNLQDANGASQEMQDKGAVMCSIPTGALAIDGQDLVEGNKGTLENLNGAEGEDGEKSKHGVGGPCCKLRGQNAHNEGDSVVHEKKTRNESMGVQTTRLQHFTEDSSLGRSRVQGSSAEGNCSKGNWGVSDGIGSPKQGEISAAANSSKPADPKASSHKMGNGKAAANEVEEKRCESVDGRDAQTVNILAQQVSASSGSSEGSAAKSRKSADTMSKDNSHESIFSHGPLPDEELESHIFRVDAGARTTRLECSVTPGKKRAGDDTTQALRFYIGPTKLDRTALVQKIVKNGGCVVSSLDANNDVPRVYPLLDAELQTVETGGDSYIDTYVDECISKRELLDVSLFQLRPQTNMHTDRARPAGEAGSTQDLKSAYVSTLAVGDGSRRQEPPSNGGIGQRPIAEEFSAVDNEAMRVFFLRERAKDPNIRHHSIPLWNKAARKRILGRHATARSMRIHFLAYLASTLVDTAAVRQNQSRPYTKPKGSRVLGKQASCTQEFISDKLRATVEDLALRGGVTKRRAFMVLRDAKGRYTDALESLTK